MLALTRIVAAQGGQGASPSKANPGKAASVQDNAFTKLLATAEGVRGAPSSRTTGGGARAAGQKAASRVTTAAVGDNAARAKANSAKPASAGDASVEASRAKAGGLTAPNGAVVKRRSEPAEVAAQGGEASTLVASAAQAASGAQAPKPAPALAKAVTDQPRSGGENGSSGIETIGVGTERRSDGAKVTVVDLRLKAKPGNASRRETSGEARSESDDRGGLAPNSRPASGVDGANSGVAFDKGAPDAGETVSQPKEGAPAPAQPTAEGLASRLRDGAADIVRSAQVVLRGGDSGVIRLRLEPESLGGVKIELKMTEKQISGRIVVESDLAAEAFRSSLDSLKDAFAECGFETSALEVEVRNGMASGPGNGDGQAGGDRDEGPYWSRSLRELEAAVPQLVESGRNGLLDVVV